MDSLLIKVVLVLLLCLLVFAETQDWKPIEAPTQQDETQLQTEDRKEVIFYGDYPVASASTRHLSKVNLPPGFHVEERTDSKKRNKVRLIYIPVSQLEPELRNILEGGETSLESLTRLNPDDVDVYHLPQGADEVKVIQEQRALRRIPPGDGPSSKPSNKINLEFLKSFLPSGSTILRVRAYKGILPPNLNADTLKSASLRLLQPADLNSGEDDDIHPSTIAITTTRRPVTAKPFRPLQRLPPVTPRPIRPLLNIPPSTVRPFGPFPRLPPSTPRPPLSIFSPGFSRPVTQPFSTPSLPFAPYPTTDSIALLPSTIPGRLLTRPAIGPSTFPPKPTPVTHPHLKVPLRGKKPVNSFSTTPLSQSSSPAPLPLDGNDLSPLNAENPRLERKIPRPTGVNQKNKEKPFDFSESQQSQRQQPNVEISNNELVLVVDINHINPGKTAALMVDSRVSASNEKRELPQVFIAPIDYPLPTGYSRISIRYPPEADLPVFNPNEKSRKLPPAYLAKPTHIAPPGYIKILLPSAFVEGANLKELIRKAAFPFINEDIIRPQRKIPGSLNDKHSNLKPAVTRGSPKPSSATRTPLSSRPFNQDESPPSRPFRRFPESRPLFTSPPRVIPPSNFNIFPSQGQPFSQEDVSQPPQRSRPSTFQRPSPRPPAPVPNFKPTLAQPSLQNFQPFPIPKPPRTYFASSSPVVPLETETTPLNENVTPRNYLASGPKFSSNSLPTSTPPPRTSPFSIPQTVTETEIPTTPYRYSSLDPVITTKSHVTQQVSSSTPRIPGFKPRFRPPLFSRPLRPSLRASTQRPEKEQVVPNVKNNLSNLRKEKPLRKPNYVSSRRPVTSKAPKPDVENANLPNAFIGPASQPPPEGYIRIPLPPTSINFEDNYDITTKSETVPSSYPTTTLPPKITTYRPSKQRQRFSPSSTTKSTTTTSSTTTAAPPRASNRYKNLFQRPRQRLPGFSRYSNREQAVIPSSTVSSKPTRRPARRYQRPSRIQIKKANIVPTTSKHVPVTEAPYYDGETSEVSTLFPPFHVAVQKYRDREAAPSESQGDDTFVEFGARINPKTKKPKHKKPASGKPDLVLSGSENIEQLLTQEREQSPQRLEEDEDIPIVYGISQDTYTPFNLQGPFYANEKPKKEDMYVVYAEEMSEKDKISTTTKAPTYRGSRKYEYKTYNVREQQTHNENTNIQDESKKDDQVEDATDEHNYNSTDYKSNYDYYDENQYEDYNKEEPYYKEYEDPQEYEDEAKQEDTNHNPEHYEYYTDDTQPHEDDYHSYDYSDPDYYYDDYSNDYPKKENKTEESTEAAVTLQEPETEPSTDGNTQIDGEQDKTTVPIVIQTEEPSLPTTTTEKPNEYPYELKEIEDNQEDEQDVNDLNEKTDGKVLGISTATEISHKARVCFNGRCVELET